MSAQTSKPNYGDYRGSELLRDVKVLIITSTCPGGHGFRTRFARNSWIALLMCQNDEDLPAKDKIPRAKVDAQLIKDMLQHVGVCAEEPKLLFVKTEQEVIDGLKAATDCMKECAVLRLLVCYFGHGYCRSFNGSTWMELQENVTLECTVRRELRKAKLEKAKQVVIADCCQPLRVWAPGDSDQEWQHGLSGLYSAEKNKMTGDTGHFAHALAYCLSCQPSSLSELFSDVQDLVRQLTFFRQQCEFVYRSSQTKIRLFPGKPYAEPLAAVSEIDLQEFPKLFHSPLFFLARWLCELSGNELRRLNVKPSMFRKETDEIIRLMKDIFDQLKEKACLFTGNQWFQQLNLVYDCSDLNEVLKWLQKRPVPPESQDALSQEQLCRPCYITPDIQQFLLESLREAVKDEFDDRFAQNDDEGTNDESEADDKFEDSNGRPTVKAAAELWEHLSEYFYVSNHKLFDTDKGTQMTFTYAIYAEGVHGIEQAKERLQEIRSEIDELSEVFGIDTANFKLFLCPGSLWIIIRSDTILQQLKEFMDGLAKWYEERCDADAHWERTKSPRQVKLSTVPQRLLDLVLQVENYVDVGSCMWLHAEDVQKHSLKRLNVEVGREHGGRLQEWQVAVFEGDIEAKGTSWLQGHGGLRLGGLGGSWRVLDLPSDLRSDLEKLADDRQWQQDFTFHAAAFVMHIEQKGFEWIGVVISQEDEEAPGASLCVEPLIALPNKTKEEVLRRLDEAAELMKRRGANHLLVCYFGHGYLRHWGSTWVQLKDIHGEDSPLSLECSVTAALRRAKLEWTKQEQLCRPCYITADIQECLLESLRKAVKDEFDAPKEKEVKDGFDKQISNLPDDPEGPSCVKKAALLWENLSRFFEECDGKLFETSEGIVMKCTYAICLEGDKEIEYCGGSATAEKSFCEEDMKLQRLANSINELSKVFDADTKKYRVFLEPICE
eukprot:Skav212626  [mRNA]  locus=scaffold173:206450:213442:+ [translate_table: standard]